jgi:hypothetical protein
VFAQQAFRAVQWVGRDVQAQHLPFVGEQLLAGPLVRGELQVGQRARVARRGGGLVVAEAEQVELAHRLLALQADDRLDRFLVCLHQGQAGVAQ